MNDLDGEIWKDISDWPFYQVSNFGRVRILPGGLYWRRIVTDIELKTLVSKDDYMMVSRGDQMFYVHRLVLEAFSGPCPPGLECRHLNGNPSDNRWPENIKWGTDKENQGDRVSHGTSNHGERNGMSKLTEADIVDIRARPQYHGVNTHLAIEYGVRDSTIQRIRCGKRRKSV
jgi:hypothetical protein